MTREQIENILRSFFDGKLPFHFERAICRLKEEDDYPHGVTLTQGCEGTVIELVIRPVSQE